MPRGEKPETGALGLFQGLHSIPPAPSPVDSIPDSAARCPPGKPSTLPQTMPSVPTASAVECGVQPRVLRRVGSRAAQMRTTCPGSRRSAPSAPSARNPDRRLVCRCRSYPAPAPSSLAIFVRRASGPTSACSASPLRLRLRRCWSKACCWRPSEHQVMRAVTGVDQRSLLRRRIVHRQLPSRSRDRRELRRRQIRTRFAEVGIVARADARREPDAPSLIEHRIVYRRVAVPDRFVTPERRGLQRLRLPRRVRIAIRNFHLTDGVVYRIEHRQIVAALFRRSIDQPIGIDSSGCACRSQISSCR